MENLMGNDERLATDNVEHSVKSAELIRDRFSHLKIIARARDRQHAFRLLNAGVDEVVERNIPFRRGSGTPDVATPGSGSKRRTLRG